MLALSPYDYNEKTLPLCTSLSDASNNKKPKVSLKR